MTYTTQGIILRRRDFNEDDCFYSIYTQDHGKIEAVAQGVRKIRSKLAAHLEPLCLGEFMFANGRQIERLIQARLLENFGAIKKDLQLLGQAGYLADVTDLLTKQGEKEARIFELLRGFFAILNQNRPAANLEQIFVVKLLQFLGFELILNQCVVCHQPLESPLSVNVAPDKGGVVCLNCSPQVLSGSVLISSLTLETVRNIYTTPHLDLHPVELPELIKQELKDLAFVYSEAHLEVKPKSRYFLEFIYAQ